MSIFAVNHLCREVLRDHAFRAAMKSDPAKALAPLDLSDDERRALLAGDVGAEVSAAEAATRLDPESQSAWASYAHALARTDRISECIEACNRALALGKNEDVSDLLQRVQAAQPRSLSERTAA